MRTEQYTCDRCGAKMDSHPKIHGEWTFSIGHYCMLSRDPTDAGHLCSECHDQIVSLVATFWAALFPKLQARR